MMFDKIATLFKGSKNGPEQVFLQENNIQIDAEHGFIVDGIVLNRELSERLEYFSNRKLNNFDDLKALFYKTILINEKIDLEIATQRYVARLENTQEKLLQLKAIIQILNQYYILFLRDK